MSKSADEYKGKNVLITGAGRGIGKRLALGFARRGARIAIVGRSKAEVDLAHIEIEQAGGNALRIRADVNDQEQLTSAVERIKIAFGGPIHVLLSDREAEHIPGCNMAFRKWALQAIGGFDPQFRTAGDDVDVCWRLLEKGWTIGFNAAAMVWHHRRNSVITYWKQQVGYGRAEASLEAKWPEKYNAVGHLTWSGRLYGKGLTKMLGSRRRIYHGEWGSALFQSIYEPASHAVWSLPLMPEWYLFTAVLGLISVFGLAWKSLFLFSPLFVLAAVMPVVQALRSATHATFATAPRTLIETLALRGLTAALHKIGRAHV